jgi:hypothetical protein
MGNIFCCCKRIVWRTLLDYESDDDLYWEGAEKEYNRQYGKNSYQNQFSNQLPEADRTSFRY